LETLRVGDVPAHRQLAGYLSAGTWFAGTDGPEPDMLRELVADEDWVTVKISLLGTARLARNRPALAIEIALVANIGNDGRLAEDLCMALNDITDQICEDQVHSLLTKLLPIPSLEYWAHDVLGKLAPHHRETVLQFLLDRASAGGDVRAFSFHDYDVDLLGGADGDELLAMLRRVRDTMLGADSHLSWELKNLYWQLAPGRDATLTVLSEWLVSDDDEQITTAVELLDEMPWNTALVAPDFIESVLDAASGRGKDSLQKMTQALIATTAMTGDHSRTLGTASPRDEQLREEASKLAERFGIDTPARRFYDAVVAHAERNINEDAQEDEEFSERR